MKSITDGLKQVACVARAEISADVTPRMRVQIMPWGRFDSNAGDGNVVPTLVDEVAVQMMNRTFDFMYRDRKIDLVFDYEHQSKGQNRRDDGLAPASGWMRHDSAGFIGVPGDGVYVDVEWTPKAQELVRNREYRYLSFEGWIQESDGRVLSVNTVGLTNDPQTSVKPIVNSVTAAGLAREFLSMLDSEKFDRARWFLNLPETATPEEITMEFEKFLSQMRSVLGMEADAKADAVLNKARERLKAGVPAAVCKAAGVADTASETDVVNAINARSTKAAPVDLSGYVPRAEFDAISNSLKATSEQLTAVSNRSIDRDAADRIADAKAAGKLNDAMLVVNADGSNYFKTLARDEKAWAAWLERTPVVSAPAGRVVTNSAAMPVAAAGGRVAVINKARAEHDDAGVRKLFPNREAWVRQSLRDAGLDDELTADDKKLIA